MFKSNSSTLNLGGAISVKSHKPDNLVCILTLVAMTPVLAFCSAAVADPGTAEKTPVETIRSAVTQGKVAFSLTTPDELEAILGPTSVRKKRTDGGMEILTLRYPDLVAGFGRMTEFGKPFTLRWLSVEGLAVDVGQDKQVVLKSKDDLSKFDPFSGFTGVSLVELDLRPCGAVLAQMPFDTRTEWPPRDKMPAGFDPAALLDKGKNPGLAVRDIHRQAIDGRRVGIAIVDQPLLKDHIEYKWRLARYQGFDVEDVPPQMHAPAVASLAVGKNCGVAPNATLYYFAVPMWKWTNQNENWAGIIKHILKVNRSVTKLARIRVISISLGTFSRDDNFDLVKDAINQAEETGVLVVTCDPVFLKYGTLTRLENEDPDRFSSYRRGKEATDGDLLRVPAANRTIASHHGPNEYTYDRQGGISWAAPYLAGLAVLAFQVDPDIEPKKIRQLWLETAEHTEAGPIVNPKQFIEAVKKLRQSPSKK